MSETLKEPGPPTAAQVQAMSLAPPATPEAGKEDASKDQSLAKKGKEQELHALTESICTGFGELKGLLKKSSDIARGLGEHLLQAKKLVKEGCWTAWLVQHCKLTDRQAQKYMRLAATGTTWRPSRATTRRRPASRTTWPYSPA
jgi:hypothetical protein